jgi:hypothetical protein
LSGPAVRDKIVAIEESAKWNFPDLNELWGSVDVCKTSANMEGSIVISSSVVTIQ